MISALLIPFHFLNIAVSEARSTLDLSDTSHNNFLCLYKLLWGWIFWNLQPQELWMISWTKWWFAKKQKANRCIFFFLSWLLTRSTQGFWKSEHISLGKVKCFSVSGSLKRLTLENNNHLLSLMLSMSVDDLSLLHNVQSFRCKVCNPPARVLWRFIYSHV